VSQLIDTNSNSWNTATLRDLFHEHDVQAILKINLPSDPSDDRIAWHFEKNGQFTVKSTYRLAFNLKHHCRESTSKKGERNDSRPGWDLIWKADVPPKVRVFGSRVETDSLAMKRNKWRRNLESDSTCNLCGNAIEDAHHATVVCMKDASLRHALRKCWQLPDEQCFRFTSLDWLQNLLGQASGIQRDTTLMPLWRAWHLRNDAVHDQGKATIAASVSLSNLTPWSLATLRLTCLTTKGSSRWSSLRCCL
jgi:hypothetical protein